MSLFILSVHFCVLEKKIARLMETNLSTPYINSTLFLLGLINFSTDSSKTGLDHGINKDQYNTTTINIFATSMNSLGKF
uniref:Uncharacterized protein n=1 Tax=Lepeophtheirus salmonis TaxID=72036 RepID=A0A0K2USD8_LEPSM